MVNFNFDFNKGTERQIRQARRVYDELPSAYRRRVIRPGLNAWARIIARAARMTRLFADGPRGDRQLRKSIATRRATRRRAVAGRVADGAFVVAEAPHAHLVELGHAGPKPAPAHPFMRHAANTTEAQGLAAMARKMTERTFVVARQLMAKFPTGR